MCVNVSCAVSAWLREGESACCGGFDLRRAASDVSTRFRGSGLGRRSGGEGVEGGGDSQGGSAECECWCGL